MVRRKIAPYLLIFPNLLIYCIFTFVPVVWVAVLSFTDYNVYKPGSWVGLSNYADLWRDGIFLQSLTNTLFYWVFTVAPAMAVGLIAAILVSAKIRGAALFRAIIYLPGIISSVAISMIWLWMYDPLQGPVNLVLGLFGFGGENWLKDPQFSLFSVIVVGIWVGIGFAMIVYLAGLQGIPEHLYEAAGIDGATRIRQFFSITLPLLRPISFFLFVTATIMSFQVFDLVYIMTQGGPVNSTTTIVNEIVKAGFDRYQMGYASAMSMVLLIATLLITFANYKFGSKDSEVAS